METAVLYLVLRYYLAVLADLTRTLIIYEWYLEY
jgi:hypothetical protein